MYNIFYFISLPRFCLGISGVALRWSGAKRRMPEIVVRIRPPLFRGIEVLDPKKLGRQRRN